MAIRKLLGVSIAIATYSLGTAGVSAQSWQDWVKNNPTYHSTPSSTHTAPPAPAPQSIPTSTPSQNPPQPQVLPQGNQPEFFSTHNPLFKQQFMQSCQASDLPISYCNCTLKEIQNNYTFQEVIQIAEFMESNQEIPSELLEVAVKCLPG